MPLLASIRSWPAALAVLLAACAHTGPPADVAPALEPEPSAALQPHPGESAGAVVVSALSFLGVRYRRGGDSAEQGFDCSGFTRHVFAGAGLQLPRRSQEQARAPGLRAVERSELEPGDLVFFNTLGAAFSHVGIYTGEGRFIHAPRTGAEVRLEDLRGAYWRKRYNGARRAAWPSAPALAVKAPHPSR